MRTEVHSSNLIVPIWTQDQCSVLHRHNTVPDKALFLPLNQHACAALNMSIPDWWPDFSYAALNEVGDKALAAWRSGPRSSSVLTESLIWRSAREATYINYALDRYIKSCGNEVTTISALLPNHPRDLSAASFLDLLGFFVVRDYAQNRGLGFRAIPNPPSTPVRPLPRTPRDSAPPETVDSCILAFAVPDLGRVVFEYAAQPGRTLLIATPDCAFQIARLRSITNRTSNVFLHQLGHHLNESALNPDPVKTEDLPDQIPPFLSQLTPYSIASFCTFLDRQLEGQVSTLVSELEAIVVNAKPDRIAVANHDSVFTKTMCKAAAKTGAQLRLYEHSLWPLQNKAIELSLTDRVSGQHIYYLQSAKAHLTPMTHTKMSPTFRRWSTLRVNPLRLFLNRLKRKLSEFVFGPKIGLVVTTGQACIAPDVPPRQILKSVTALVKTTFSLNQRAHLLIRLRDTQDNEQLILKLIRDAIEPRFRSRVSVSRQSGYAFRSFVRKCHRIVEVGLSTSASHEAFLHKVPVYRLTKEDSASVRFVGRPVSIIRCGQNDFGQDVQRLLSPDQSDLLRDQFAYLLDEVTPADG